MKSQERGQLIPARFSSGHVAQAMNLHEQVTNDKRSNGETSKEATGHQ
jgi:hypothetical protein